MISSGAFVWLYSPVFVGCEALLRLRLWWYPPTSSLLARRYGEEDEKTNAVYRPANYALCVDVLPVPGVVRRAERGGRVRSPGFRVAAAALMFV